MLKFIDLFCGAGGVTSGIHDAIFEGNKCAEVIACINHDENAIKSHASNHPGVLHYTEDIRTLDISDICTIVQKIRNQEESYICLWASLECTNFSKAKGGLPRDADSRTLAEHLYRYVEQISPDYIFIENVEEFMSWGPLDKNKKPISKDKGKDYIKWIRNIKSYGYNFESRILNCADYGAHTKRKRYFAIFAKHQLPISWPLPTHAENPQKELFRQLQKWKPVKEVLHLEQHGNSIFTRKKSLSEKTLERIYNGLIKYVAGGKEAFILKYLSNNAKTGTNHGADIENPSPTVTTQNRLALVNIQNISNTQFLKKYYSGKPEFKSSSIDSPSGTITTVDHHALVSCQQADNFLIKYYSTGKNICAIDQCAPTLTTKDCLGLVSNQFIYRDFSNNGKGHNMSIDSPGGAVLPNPKMNLVTAQQFIMDTQYNNTGQNLENPLNTITANRKWHYLMNPQYFNTGSDINKPCFTLIARMDKKPPYLIEVNSGQLAIEISPLDSPFTVKIKEFMAMYGIVDVKMRMLSVLELLKIQGFKPDYILIGTQADQKKFVGNAVPPPMVKAIIEEIYRSLKNIYSIAI